MSTDLHTLSGAYAVNALSADEARLFDTHLEGCQACRDEVRELQDAAARMGASESVAPPAALRARILAAADREAQLPPRVTSISAAPSRRWTSRLVAAAAAVVLVLTGGFVALQSQGDDSNVVAATVSQVFKASDARTRTVPTDRGRLVVAISPTLGQVAVRTNGLQPLTGRRVYQMWTIHSGTSTSQGVVENLAAGKVMALPSEGTTVAITIEPDGESVHPTTPPIVTLDPQSV
ncbi:MAG: anti-sigma factor [Nocardioidaceae bacterium]